MHGAGRRGAGLSRRQLLRSAAGLGAAAGAGGLLAACSGAGATPARPAAARRPVRGGNLALGLTGGSISDTINPGGGVADIDYARIFSIYQPLVWLDPQARVEYVLAESIEPDGGDLTRWIIKLQPGITFHSGKPLTAGDVVYTFRRILTGKLPGSSPLAPVDLNGTRALDARTVLVKTTKPYGSFVDQLASVFAYLPVVPEGFTTGARPDGTGPFIYKSFTPGQRSVFTRNKNYWKPGLPHVDEITIIDFSDSLALANALILGQVHGAGLLDGTVVRYLREPHGLAGVAVVPSPSGAITPFTMRVDKPPFNDVRVRQAMRLLVNRPQLIQDALSGFGTWASDVFSPYDPDFDRSLHRIQDTGQAHFLLKQAGHENLKVTLVTSAVSTGTVQMATVLAEQASEAGVTINVQNVPPATFFGPDYLSWVFAQDYYPYSTYLGQVAYSMLKVSPFNETHTNSPYYQGLFDQANATANPGLRGEILHKMQEYDYTQGGYIIPAFIDAIDAYSARIGGYATDCKQGNPLSNFAFEHFYFT
jgi:peptide/nickel transport system substrate-binding protein